MFKNEACEILKTKELTFVNDCFEYERNEVIGHYRQILSSDGIYRTFVHYSTIIDFTHIVHF